MNPIWRAYFFEGVGSTINQKTILIVFYQILLRWTCSREFNDWLPCLPFWELTYPLPCLVLLRRYHFPFPKVRYGKSFPCKMHRSQGQCPKIVFYQIPCFLHSRKRVDMFSWWSDVKLILLELHIMEIEFKSQVSTTDCPSFIVVHHFLVDFVVFLTSRNNTYSARDLSWSNHISLTIFTVVIIEQSQKPLVALRYMGEIFCPVTWGL